ncbi:MAG: hypothetical protein ACE5EO_11430 [Candidatus Krumholzibacteriia bacterium]
MKRLLSLGIPITSVALWIGLLVWPGSVQAYDQYSQNKDATNCRACHGDFRAGSYTSLADGQNWGNLHNLHRSTMLNGDCNTCHSGASRFPVLLASSTGGDGLAAISCVGCHGRTADDVPANPSSLGKLGAGLRQHHFNSGVTNCATCHADADPANYLAAGEKSPVPYYANPGNNHPNMPGDACSALGDENFAGSTDGLDNDGDGIYDFGDPDCLVPVEPTTWGAIKAIYATR